MDINFFLEVFVAFLKWTVPIVMVLSLTIFIKPKLFADLEKILSLELGSKKISRRTIDVLEKENLALQQALLRNNRITGLFCFILAVIVIARLY